MIKKISNVSSTLIINSYEGFFYEDKNDKKIINEDISKKYSKQNLLSIIRNISKKIKTEILHESSHSFDPFGDSGTLLIQADLSLYNSATIHLKESHITFHTYVEDIFDNILVIRLELHISSCSESNVYDAFNEVFNKNMILKPELITLDYLRRGAKYGVTHKDILIDSYNFSGITISKENDVYENEISSNTKNNALVMQKKYINKKFLNYNKFFSIDFITKYKNFLLSSYLDNYMTLSNKSAKSIK